MRQIQRLFLGIIILSGMLLIVIFILFNNWAYNIYSHQLFYEIGSLLSKSMYEELQIFIIFGLVIGKIYTTFFNIGKRDARIEAKL